jgi:hypothetical protein
MELRIDPIPVICKLNIAISIELDACETSDDNDG